MYTYEFNVFLLLNSMVMLIDGKRFDMYTVRSQRFDKLKNKN